MSEPSASRFRFIDLFAGIGGIRLAMEAAGGTCVLSSEWDRFARRTYEAFFGQESHFLGDIREIEPENLPRHDVLCGGFPCQPFSLAGVSKKNSLGRAHGFDDPTQGTLFFNVKEMLRVGQPAAFLLENVKHLRRHDRGRTWNVIARSLSDAGYVFDDRIIDAARVVPQHRERIFIVGFRKDLVPADCATSADWSGFWAGVDAELDRENVLQRHRYGVRGAWPKLGAILQPADRVDRRFVLTPRLWEYLQDYRRKHEARGNGFGFGLVDERSDRTRTLSARYYKDGSEILVNLGEGRVPRRLTPLECLRLQGFPAHLEAFWDGRKTCPVSDTQAYRQFGNSVAVPVVSAIARVLRDHLLDASLRNRIATRAGTQRELPLLHSQDIEEPARAVGT